MTKDAEMAIRNKHPQFRNLYFAAKDRLEDNVVVPGVGGDISSRLFGNPDPK
jgi:hypothetical protein